MFIVYGLNGQSYRGPLENLSRVPGVPAARRTRAPESEGDELGPEYRFDVNSAGSRTSAPGAAAPVENSPYAKAAAAYAKLLPEQLDRGPVRHAYQVMTRDVYSLPADATVRSAWQGLMARGVHQAPVLGATMEVVGLVNERDLLTVIDVEGEELTGWLDRTVAEVMRSPVVCVDPVTDIRRIARVLLDTGLTALPVVGEAGKLIGVVSRGDILRAAVADPPLSLWV